MTDAAPVFTPTEVAKLADALVAMHGHDACRVASEHVVRLDTVESFDLDAENASPGVGASPLPPASRV